MNTEHPYERLTPDTVLNAVEAEGFICDGRIYPLNSYENRVYQIGIEESAPLIAKFYRPDRWNKAQLEEEHNFCLELANAELPVVPPIINQQGETLRHYDSFYFALYERKGGYALEIDNMSNLEIMGRFLGRMHTMGQVRTFKHRPAINVQTWAQESQQFLLTHSFIPIELKSNYRTVTETLITKLEETFALTPYQAIRLHGDCHAGNILWRDNHPHFVDFDDTLSGPAVQDIWMLLSGEPTQQQQQLSAILKEYQQFCTFNRQELKLIEALRTLRIMHYAAWLAKRWNDPAFPHTFTWFNSYQYWSEHIQDLHHQLTALDEDALAPYQL